MTGRSTIRRATRGLEHRFASHLRRDAGLAKKLLRAATGPVDRPFKLTLALTWRCHHRCASCGIWSRDKGVEMDAAQLDRLFASVGDLRWLDLTGGEVITRRDFGAIAESLHRHLPKLALVHFPTGGWSTDATVAAAQALQRPGGPRVIITVSIDGPSALHDRLRGMDGAFVRATETLRRLRELPGVDAYPGMTLVPANVDAVDATVAALRAEIRGFRYGDLHVNFAHTSAHYFDNAGMTRTPAAALSGALERLVRSKGRPTDPVALIERLYLELVPEHLATGNSPLPCRSAELSAYIAPDGTTYACTIDPRPIGALADHDYDLTALWRTQRRRELAADAYAGRCVGCWTPCEAYQTLLASPVALASHAAHEIGLFATDPAAARARAGSS